MRKNYYFSSWESSWDTTNHTKWLEWVLCDIQMVNKFFLEKIHLRTFLDLKKLVHLWLCLIQTHGQSVSSIFERSCKTHRYSKMFNVIILPLLLLDSTLSAVDLKDYLLPIIFWDIGLLLVIDGHIKKNCTRKASIFI